MPYCSYCGSGLETGQTCTCERSLQKALEEAEKTDIALVRITKNPVVGGVLFMNGTNTIVAVALIIAQSIMTALFSLVYTLKANNIIKSVLVDREYSEYRIKSVSSFFFSIVFSLFFAIIFIIIMYLAQKAARLETNLLLAFELAGIRASVSIVSIFVSLLISIFFPIAGLVVFFSTGLLVAVELAAVLMRKYPGCDNKIVYCIIIGMVFFAGICLFIFSKAYSLYIPSSLMEDFGKIFHL